MEKNTVKRKGNCAECCHNGGDVCLGYGVIPSGSDEYVGCTYSLPITYLQSVFAAESVKCNAYKTKESK